MFKNSKWISISYYENRDDSSNDLSEKSILVRKEFDVSSKIKSAVAHVCALGLGVYTLNGKNVTDEVLCTPYTAYDKRLIYQSYDITEKIVSGKNVFGVHIGNGFYNENATIWNNSTCTWKDVPKMIARIDISYENGKSESILSDSSWKCHFGPCVYNRPRQGEIYDMRLAQTGFDTADFDDSKWGRCMIAKAPGGILEPMDMPPIRVIRTLKPKVLDNGIYDFGENVSGWVRIKATGKSGQKMIIKYDEALNDNGDLLGYIDCFNKRERVILSHEEHVIFSGKENEEYAPSFCYHGFRYVKLTDAPENIEVIAEVVHTDLKTTASFICEDEMLNRIHEACVRSTLNNYHGVPTDCPHREQNGWTGDALLSAHQALKNFDMYKSYRKWLLDFKDAQRPSGQIPGIVPASNWGYNWGSGPAWDSAMILIPLYMYEATGKTEIIKEMWQNIELYMDYMYSMSENYIVDYGLGDWLPPEETEMCPAIITDTAYYYAHAVACEKMAALIGEDTAKWAELSAKVRNAWRENFLDMEEHYKKQTYFACAIYQGLLNDDEIPVYAEKLAELVKENGYHIDCGILGTKYIFDALSQNGYVDVVYKMVTVPTMPSYAWWINSGLTTLAESWSMNCSLNHHMFSEVDNWMYKYLCGFDFENGEVVIKPYAVDFVSKVKVEWNDVSIERNGNEFKIVTGRNVKLVLADETKILYPGEHLCKV